MVLVTTLGSPISGVIILICLGFYDYYKNRKNILYLTFACLVFLPLFVVFKELFQRVRPDTLYVQSMAFQSYSFPSGHAYSSFLVYGLLIFIVLRYANIKRKKLVAAALSLFILMVGISRVYLGAHFPSDVLAGWFLAAAVLFLSVRVVIGNSFRQKIKSRQTRRQ